MRGYDGRWWIAGGWAIDAFVRSSRYHGDLDLGVPREDLRGFVAFMTTDLDVWAAAHGTLTPLQASERLELPDGCNNLWLRRSGADPWEYDVLLEQVQGDTWTFKRDERITRPLAHCLWSRDEITFLRPEVQLLLKAKDARPKDDLDLDRCVPRLGRDAQRWLLDSLRVAHPAHRWIARIEAAR